MMNISENKTIVMVANAKVSDIFKQQRSGNKPKIQIIVRYIDDKGKEHDTETHEYNIEFYDALGLQSDLKSKCEELIESEISKRNNGIKRVAL